MKTYIEIEKLEQLTRRQRTALISMLIKINECCEYEETFTDLTELQTHLNIENMLKLLNERFIVELFISKSFCAISLCTDNRYGKYLERFESKELIDVLWESIFDFLM